MNNDTQNMRNESGYYGNKDVDVEEKINDV